MKINKYFGIAALLTIPFTVQAAETKTAIFAGGCFWCMEKPFEQIEGVLDVISGFANGHVERPTYKQVTTGTTGHYEVVQVTYDPAQVSYEALLKTYWVNVDPFDLDGQFCDQGPPYRPAIFFQNDEERGVALASKEYVSELLKKQSGVPVLAFEAFYPAEEYHQDYYKKNATRYKFYRWNCGRDARLDAVWADIRERLTH